MKTKRCFYDPNTGMFKYSSSDPIGDWPGEPYVDMPVDFNINTHRYNTETNTVEPVE